MNLNYNNMEQKSETIHLKDRNGNLEKVKQTLINEFGNKIVSAIVYGSTLNEDFCINSDYDILMVVKRPDVKFLNKLREIKLNYMKEKIKIDFNIHSDDDIPSIRKDVFWHNNRGLYVQKEFDIYGRILIGENLFKTDEIDNYEMLKEAVKVINSLNYQARKIMINRNIEDKENKILMMKWCIYGSLYALASRGIYPKDKRTALQTFYDVFEPPINPEKFLKIKVERTENITLEDVEVAYEFLTYLDKKIFSDYINYER